MNNWYGHCAGAALAALLWASGAGTAFAADPDNVGSTLEGCRNDGTIALPNAAGKFICPDSAYTPGNLGKGWNELDLVPYRITLNAGRSAPATQTYSLAVVLDFEDAGKPGYDVISAPVLNAALSSPSCTAAAVIPGAPGALDIPGLGGIAKSIYQQMTVTQLRNTTCVYDYYGRLALGSKLFPGSSLHANLALPRAGDDDGLPGGGSSGLAVNLTTSGIGASDVSIPVKEILPQELRKDMSATADSDTQWNILKSANPLSVNFGDVCKADTPLNQEVTFRVEWIKGSTTLGGVNFVTNIYAKNPAARLITVNVTDRIYKGTAQTELLATKSTPAAGVDVPANSEIVVLTHTGTLPSSAGGIGDFLNDVATATYTDKVTGIAVPGSTSAVASAQIGQGVATNSFAAIADSESISGTGLKFSVAQPLSGGFTNYTAGTQTVGPVDWAITGQTTSGMVDFVKTVYLDARRVTSGTLTDTAVLVASPPAVGGFTKQAGPVNVGITSSAAVNLTISKTIPPLLLSATQRIDVTFRVTRSSDAFQEDKTLSFVSGETFKSSSMTGLLPDNYTVTELSSQLCEGALCGSSNLQIQGSIQQSIDLRAGADGIFQPSECAGTAAFVNVPAGGTAVAKVKKITTPALAADDPDIDWTFTLAGPGGPSVKTVKAGADFADFELVLQEGNYTVTETQKTPTWVLTNAAPDANSDKVCEFSVTYPEDFGKSFSCTFYNQKQGKAKVIKTVSGQPMTALSPYAFTFQLRQGATTTQSGTTLESGVASGANLGLVNFTTYLKPGDTYQLCEIVMPAWQSSLGTFVPSSFMPPDGVAANPNVDNSILCVDFTVAAGQTKTFEIDNSPPPGGRALTIGFWKNWASCANSAGKGQKPTLDQTLSTAPVIGDTTDGHATLPGIVMSATSGILPTFGTTYRLVVHGSPASPNSAPDCAKAVRLLDKSRIDNGKKMASDPAFNLAAQLMAAQLNYTAGAGRTTAATSAINLAVRLLGQHEFNGVSHTSINAANATTMNNLAKTLDDYNNNR
jgi:hypothetical protein